MFDTNKGDGRVLKRADPSTIHDKFMVGYQGWFTCAGDGEPVGPGHHGWLHWFNYPIPDGGRPNTDLWPDVSSYSPSELFPAPGLKTRSGEQVFLFSSRHPKTVQRHFHWMAEHGVDGAFLQRFASQCDLETGNGGIRQIRDEVGDRVREAAEKEGRVFAIMYDVSSVAPDRIQRVLERDWIHLIREQGILDSPNYLKEKGKPVVALWGFGFDNAGHTPELVRSITNYIRNITPGGAYIMAGTPAHWRTAESDADRNPGFLDVWLNDFDAISPWTVGRYRDEQDADDFAKTKMKGDVELIKAHNEEGRGRKIDYIPVVLPGGSGFNLSEGKWGYNDIKRDGGRFLWRQIFNAKRLGVRSMYGAMWDEYDEGTAFMPAVENKRLLPETDKYPFMALDEDGYDLPSDWYMRICGFAAESIRSERLIHESFPSKELQDYWASRPKYEGVNHKSGDFVSGSSGSGPSGSGDGQSYQDWLAAQASEDKDEPPPPPYSLEADEAPGNEPRAAAPAQTVPASIPGPSATPALAPSASSAPSHVPASTPNQAQAPSATGPPPINSSSRPQPTHVTTNVSPIGAPHGSEAAHSHQAYNTDPGAGYPLSGGPPRQESGTLNTQRPYNTQFQQDPVVSVTNDFGRDGTPASGPGRVTAVSPPPLHPAHPAASTYGQSRPQSPQSRPQLHSRPHSHSRPTSQSGYPQQPSSPGPTPVSPTAGQQAGPWSQAQWPPPEWRVGATAQQYPSTQQSSYLGQILPNQNQNPGANLSRPHTITASSYTASSSSSSLRPHASVSASAGRPNYHQTPPDTPGNSTASFPGNSSYSPSGPPSPAPYAPTFPGSGPSGYAPGPPSFTPGGPSFPSGSPSPYSSTSSYPGQIGSTYPGQSSFIPPTIPGQGYASTRPSPPISPSPGPSTYGGSSYPGQQPYTPGHGSPYPGQYPGSQGPVDSAGGIHFPQAQGDQYGAQPHTTSYAPSYIGQQGSHQTPATGGWYPGNSNPPIGPPMPPRPSGNSSYSQSGPSFPSASTSSVGAGALGLALSAVDKVAGRKTRTQLESGVGSLAQTGTKLFNKFAK